MKNLNSIRIKLFILTVTVALFLASQFTSPSAGEKGVSDTITNPVPDSQFIIGAFHNGTDLDYEYQDSLSLNTWHHYTAPTGWGWPGTINDNYNGDPLEYGPGVMSRIDNNNNNKGMRTLMNRPIIEYLVGGQRIDYQCEFIDSNFNASRYWYYAYRYSDRASNIVDIVDSSRYGDSIEMVKHCIRTEQSQTNGFVAIDSGLRANRELAFIKTNDWIRDDAYEWYIMPRIRIDSAFAANGNNDSITVCIIVLHGWNDTIVKEIPIRIENFKDSINNLYDGSYREMYSFLLGQTKLEISSAEIDSFFINPDGNTFWWEGSVNKTDIKIYWSGKCDMWIDRVRLENRPAHQYMTQKDSVLISKVNLEVSWAGRNYEATNPIPNYIYYEECQMSHFPAIKALNQQITTYPGSNTELIIFLNYDLFKAHIPQSWKYNLYADLLKKYLYDDYGLRTIVMGSYALEGWDEDDLPKDEQYRNSFHPITLSSSPYDADIGILSNTLSPGNYDTWLQEHFDDSVHLSGVNYSYISNLMDSLSRNGMRIINGTQSHLWFKEGHKLKEPSNEELELQANLALTYNAKGLIWFNYVSDRTYIGSSYYCRGVMEYFQLLQKPVPRTSNVYGKNKYLKVCQIDSMLAKRGPYIISFNPALTNNCIYRLSSEREEFLTNTFIGDVITYKISSTTPECTEDNPGGTSPQGLVYECKPDRYLQAATFKKSTSDINKYFMIVNRRCSPYIDESSEDNRGGRRFVRVRFDANSSEFANFNNWKIIDIDSNKTVTVFDKRATALLDLGWYNPGQGKLYKVAPVMQEGGTLVCDEAVSPSTFTCNGMVFNNGYDLTISPYTTITFSNYAGIEMNGGSFECGEFSDDSQVTFNGTDSLKGIILSNCSSVGIYNTSISDLKNDSSETAVLISNCISTNIKGSIFNAATNVGGISISFTDCPQETMSLNVSECIFLMGSSGCDALSISSNGSPSVAVLLDWCTFTTSNDSSNALRLINVTGGAVKNSTFVNFNTTITALGSAFDMYNNKILGKTYSAGIQCLTGSNLSMGPNSGLYLGGYNYIRNYGTSSSNIYTDNSFFDIDCGNNEFDIDETDYSKHLTGTMIDNGSAYVMAYKNCFHEDSITNIEAVHDVKWGETNSDVNFLFEPYFCDLTPPQDFVVFDVYGFSDTVYYKSGGEGSGINPNKTLNIEENIYKSLKDTVNINLRKRNYQTVETSSKLILTQYPDSLESIGMVQKLYMASLNLDSTKIGLTKTFLENLITNNTQNPSLIKRAFYFIQKCKVKLGQYQSALEGFQYIMTHNPYTYEGLVASWDYAATYLLMGTGGSIQGDNEQTHEDFNTPADTLLSRMSKRDINSAKNKNSNTNEQITKIFYEKIKNTTKDDRVKQEEKIKTLEKKLESSKSTSEKNEAARELATMKQIKEAVKIKKPNTVMNHIQIMNDDIKKVFGVGKQSSKESTNSLIPQTYQLYQNYPNPFNPTTKIAFDLPKDAKVKLVIYDILGREMKTLVNNEFRSAGKYITEFNGSNMASGIYFARILVNEGKDFIAVKKMVLLK
ncbi:MAG: T9SS type A sorting domain-containing protein [Candidatus Kapaibacterium sp.]